MLERAEHEDAELHAGYERLRAAVLGGRPDGFRLGHGVLATHGLVAWMQAVGSVGSPAPSASERAEVSAGEVLALPGAGELVAVMAQMALAHAA